MFTVLKPETALANKFQEKLVHNACGLEKIFRPLTAKECAGNLS